MRLPPPILLVFALSVSGCVRPAVAPPPPPVTAPVAPAPLPTSPVDWRDAPETPGGWSYVQDNAGSTARFGRANGEPDFTMRCDRASRTVILSVLGAGGGAMTVKTSYAERVWPAQIAAGRTETRITPSDPALDQIAFSRGRFSVTAAGLPTVTMPAWAEPSRVIEDCRS